MIRDNGITISESPVGSPSKVLAASLGSVSLNRSLSTSADGEGEGVVLHRIDKKRAPPKKAENHITDELQLVVDPSPAAALAQKYLRHPDPNIGKLEARKEAEAAAICAVHGPDHPGAIPAPPRNSHFDDPHESQKVWIQESLLRMALPDKVSAWEERERAKLEAKVNKGKKPAGKQSPAKKAEQTSKKTGTPTKAGKKPPRTKPKPILDSESETEDLFAPSQGRPHDVFSSGIGSSNASQSSQRQDRSIARLAVPSASYKRSKDRQAS